MELNKAPNFKLIIDQNELIEIYMDGKRLSEIMPSLFSADFHVGVTGPKTITLECYAEEIEIEYENS